MTNTDDKWVIYDTKNARVHIHDTRESAMQQLADADRMNITDQMTFYPPGERVPTDDVEEVQE